MSESISSMDAAPELASWNPALRPNSEQEEAASARTISEENSQQAGEITRATASPVEQTKSQPRHFAQSASIHHLPEPEDRESSPAPDQEPFDDLPKQGIDYTNSFPVVAGQPQSEAHLETEIPEPLPRSQAEDIIAETDLTTSSEDAHANTEAERSATGLDGGWDNADDDFFGGAGGHDGVISSGQDSRFAEGLPLVQHDEVSTEAAHTQPAEMVWGEASAEDDFFGNAATESDSGPAIPTLDRKSTSDVLGAMEFPSHETTHGDLKSPPAPTAGDLTGNGIAVSAATDVAAVVQEEEASNKDTAQPTTDLAAMWSEALDDDDLLGEDSNALDPSAFFEDDGEGFLEDVTQPQSIISPPAPNPVVDHTGQVKGFSAVSGPQRYAPSQGSSAFVPNRYQTTAPTASTTNMAFGTQPRPEPSKAQSFVDKSKGGYQSPYDLPMDLRPKRQPAPRQPSAMQNQNTIPPRRTDSYGSTSQLPPSPQVPSGPPTTAPRSATPSSGPSGTSPKPSAFFEELPMAPKPPRPASAARFATAPQSIAPSGPPQAAQIPPPRPNGPNNPPVNFDHGLVMPQRQLSFSEEGSPKPSGPAPPKASSRYSPSQTTQPIQSAVPPVLNRYSSAPAAAPPPPFQRSPSVGFAGQFQPRTSSPLARSTSISEETNLLQKNTTAAASAVNNLHRDNNTPEMSPTYQGMMQSPEKARSSTRSSFGSAVPPIMAAPVMNNQAQSGSVRRRRAPSVVKQYIPPSDDRAQDPLERWKGGPIFRFSPGGIVSSFPIETPRFSVGQAQPLYAVNVGEVKTRSAKLVTPADESISSFPGPLKAKGKKKELLSWLSKRVQTLKDQPVATAEHENRALIQSRHDERILLFQVLAILVENDGALETPSAVSAVRDVLVPPPPPVDPQFAGASYGSGFAPGITRSATTQPKTHTQDVNDVEEVRKLLLKGEREKAAWYAVDKNLWGHAMLISSTIQGETWKQVVHEFVRNEVKTVGNNTEALAAVYDVFSGNWEESVDQLVPASARSGFQMISKTGSTSSENALAGLDRWQETVALTISNRTTGDAKALVALGQMLATYGRAEAAHICYMIAKVPGLFSGADDPQAHVVLLGANHRQRPSDFHKDTEAILATEVYEFAVNVLAGSSANIPLVQLTPFKLQHAYVLAEAGHRDEAQQYCETITASLKANKTAPYVHPQLITNLDDLINRLSQAPRDPSKSWLANPKMGNVSSSLLSSFTKFVAGDDSDNASTASGPTPEPGPFGAISAEPISVSRSASPAVPGMGVGYGAQNGYNPGMPAAGGSSRYAPTGSYSSSPSGSYTAAPHRDSSGSLPRMSPDHFRKMPTSTYQSQGPYTPTSGLAHAQSYTSEIPKPVPSLNAPANTSFDHALDSRPGTSEGLAPNSQRRTSYEPLSVPKPQRDRNSTAYQPRSSGYESRGSSSYAPRTGSYAPRSYAPSPAASERIQPEASPDAISGYVPQVAAPEEPAVQPIEEPISQSAEEPQIELQSEQPAAEDSKPIVEAPISFGYDPTPSYGYQAPPPDTAEASRIEPASQPSYGYQSSDPVTDNVAAEETGGYEPSSSYTPYEPSQSYQPYEPDAGGDQPDSPVKPKKKGIMDLDDNDDFGGGAEQLKKEEKARKDREAEDAFRRAAEADAARDAKPAAGQKKGWFGGWLGSGAGKKEQDKGLEPTVHRAKLGDESSFVYDENLKKWVNKKGGAEAATAKTATPPPPKAGPPSRAASAMGPPRGAIPTSLPGSISVPPSRNASPLVNMQNQDGAFAGSEAGTPPMNAAAGAGAPPPMEGGLAPPSRPGTGMSGATRATTGDDLLGSLGPRKGGAAKKAKKGGRYVDVMAK